MARSGWRTQTFDARDFRLGRESLIGPPILPPIVDLPRPFEVHDQGTVPCCVSAAIVACMEVLDALSAPAVRLSPLFHYYVSRPNPQTLASLEIRQGLRAASSIGICGLAEHAPPMTPNGARHTPNHTAFSDAINHKLEAIDIITQEARYWQLSPLDHVAWRRAIGMRMPIAAGFWITDAYRALSSSTDGGFARHGDVHGHRSNEGHCVAIVGYNDSLESFLVRDSRGSTFGTDGYWHLPYSLLASHLVAEAWALERVSY